MSDERRVNTAGETSTGESMARAYWRDRAAGVNGNQWRQPKRTVGRLPGETNADAIARLAGELAASERDRKRAEAERDQYKVLLDAMAALDEDEDGDP